MSDRAPLDEHRVREIVREELRRMFARVLAPEGYSTRPGCAAPGYSREGWRAVAKSIGVRRGRYWYVTPEQLAAYERRDPKPSNVSPWTPAKAAEAMGLRAVGGKR